MPFVSSELKKLSKDIINRALQKQTFQPRSNLLVERLRQTLRTQKPRAPRF